MGFQKFILEEGTDSGVFLDGTLKITRSNYGSPFSFYGRIASHSVFDQVSNFLKSDNSMVILALHKISFIELFYSSDDVWTPDRAGAPEEVRCCS